MAIIRKLMVYGIIGALSFYTGYEFHRQYSCPGTMKAEAEEKSKDALDYTLRELLDAGREKLAGSLEGLAKKEVYPKR